MWPHETPDQIQCIVHHNGEDLLAFGCGNDVFVASYEIPKGTSNWTMTLKTLLPPPPRLPNSNVFLPSPIARSISFLKANQLLVAYLDHGVV